MMVFSLYPLKYVPPQKPCSLQHCEILLSLGDSTDRRNEICYQYARQFSIIRVIKQGGKGLSNARNSATQKAKGKYLLFLDSDDYIISENLADFSIVLCCRKTFSSGTPQEISKARLASWKEWTLRYSITCPSM